MSKAIRDAMLAAIEYAGSEWKLADLTGYAQHSIWRAKTLGRCSPRMANAIEAATDGKVTRLELCPQIFGRAVIRKPTEYRAAS